MTITEAQLNAIMQAMSVLLLQRSTLDQEEGTDGNIIDAGMQAIREIEASK